jgi:hypothetical protein
MTQEHDLLGSIIYDTTNMRDLLTNYHDIAYFQRLLKDAKDPTMIAFYQEAIRHRTAGLSMSLIRSYDRPLDAHEPL